MTYEDDYTHIFVSKTNRERINDLKTDLGLTQDETIDRLLNDFGGATN